MNIQYVISKCFLVFTILFLCFTSPGYSLPQFMEEIDTEVVIDIEKKALDRQISAKGEYLEYISDSEVIIPFSLNKGQEKKAYALRIDRLKPPKVVINGKNVDIYPVEGVDGWYFRIGPYLLKNGINKLRLVSQDDIPLNIKAVQMASLEQTAEDAHFERFFSKPLLEKVQPDTHVDQLKYDAAHYDLDITLNMNNTYISGTLIMTATSTDSTLQNVVLDFHKNGGAMVVSSVDQGPSTATLTFNHSEADKRLYITLPAPVSAGNTFTVRVFYSGTPDPNPVESTFGASYRSTTHGSSVPIIYTFSQPYGARCWWPCKDIPEDKATVDLHITCPTAYTPVSNGSLESLVDNGNGTHTYNWSESYPVVTYLVSICCTNYQKFSDTYTALDSFTTMEVAHYVYPENYTYESQGMSGTMTAMEFFTQTFGEYPFLREKYVTATHPSGSGMEHQTCTSMPNGDIGREEGMNRRNVHELCHQWYGDCITMEHYDHLWLNEGFATYSEALFYEWRDGKDAFHNYVNAWSTSDAYPIVSTSADSFSGYIVYRKGAWVLHMLRKVIGDVDFFQSLRDYYADPNYQYGTALSEDFKSSVENTVGGGTDLSWFFDEWLYRAVRPSYSWSWNFHSSDNDTIIDIDITQTQSGDPYIMPITFLVSDITDATTTFTITNDLKTQSFEVNIGEFDPIDVVFDYENWILAYETEVAPDMVIISSVVDVPGNENELLVTWQENTDIYCDGYELYKSESNTNWTLVADKSLLTKSTTSYTVTGLTPGIDYYFKLRAIGDTGSQGDFSDVYGGVPVSGSPQVLIVEGYDRWDSQRGGSYEGAYYHGEAVAANGASFDTCDNDVVGSSVNLSDYPVVVWILGEESTGDETFSSSEQSLVETYLNDGGNLFVSGSEIGWDLDYRGDTSDKSFYNDYLKADYVDDDADTFTAQGSGGGIFSGVGSFDFDFYYYANYPDQLSTSGGSSVCMTYVGGSGGNAAVQYNGIFKVVYLGFGFETIDGESNRNAIMSAALDFFGLSIVPCWMVY